MTHAVVGEVAKSVGYACEMNLEARFTCFPRRRGGQRLFWRPFHTLKGAWGSVFATRGKDAGHEPHMLAAPPAMLRGSTLRGMGFLNSRRGGRFPRVGWVLRFITAGPKCTVFDSFRNFTGRNGLERSTEN